MHAAAVYPAGMPYGEAPIWCFPVFEYGTYLILLICLVYAARQGKRDVMLGIWLAAGVYGSGNG
jgi:hypothetical protein